MIALETVVYTTLFLIGCGFVFALLFYAVWYCEREVPQAPPLVWKALRIFLVLTAVFVLICVILDFIGHPIVTWRGRAGP